MAKPADQSLFEVLAAFAGLTSVLGEGANFRCFPVEATQGAVLPLLVYQQIATNPATTLDEGSEGAARLDGCLFQLTALAATQLAAANILYQARLAIEASATLRGILTDERALPRAEEAQCHARAADFRIWNNPDAEAA